MRTTPMLSKGMTRRTAVATRGNTCRSSMVSEVISAISERTAATVWASMAAASLNARPMAALRLRDMAFENRTILSAESGVGQWRRGGGDGELGERGCSGGGV